MDFASIHKPSRLNLDKAKKYLQPNESAFMLNHDVNNASAFGKGTPLPANYPSCDKELPAGENYTDGTYYSALTNEAYSWHYNSNSIHHIQRINGDGECEIVYTGDCLKLSVDPKATITQFRAILDVDELCSKIPGGKLKRLVWTDGTDTPIGCIDVESAIATNFFTTSFFDNCDDPCAYIQLCVPNPIGCLYGEFIPFTDADKALSNTLLDKGFKFAYRDIYYDGRASILSDWSSLLYQDSKGCFDNSDGFSRCIKFRIPLGNPMVEKKEFYFSDNGGVNWFLYETIEKYKKYNNTQQYWFQRDLSENISSTFNPDDCTFEYIFCNDKQRIPIDPVLLTRILNPIPREAQGLFRIKDTIAAYNYVAGSCPIDKIETDKFTIGLDCNDTAACNTDFAKVTVRAIVYTDVTVDRDGNITDGIGMGGYVFRANGTVGIENVPDDVDDPASFGSGFLGSDQQFRGKIRNFIPYIEGTDYWGQMEQYRSSANFNSTYKVGVLARLGDSGPTFAEVQRGIKNGNFYYQEFIFNVPKGMKGYVRLASHYQTSGAGTTNQATSTNVWGMLGVNGLKSYNGNTQLTATNERVKEMYFDTCDGDFDNFDAFVIQDLRANPDGGYSGYITDKNKSPIEGAQIYGNAVYERMTDFNGFYFFHHPDPLITVNINVEQGCTGGFTTIDHFDAKSGSHQMGFVSHEITSQAYADGYYAKVNVPVKDCDNKPIRGVRVALSGSKYKITDASGIARFKVRNYETRNREVVAIVMDKRNCFNLDCFDNCNPCMPASSSTLLIACFPPISLPEYTLSLSSNINIKNLIANKYGLKSGGMYAFGIVSEGDCGILSAVNPLFLNGGYVSIPKTQEKGVLSFCSFSYNANNMLLPTWVKRLKIVRSVNTKPYKLQWVVDKVDRTADSKIVLTIQSLNDYNAQYNFKTNTIYQYLKGDRVEFIKNGDGEIFDSATNGILNYLILNPFNDQTISDVTDNADYFNQLLINDDGKLEDLIKGAIIEIQPSALSTEQVTYFEICASLPVENGMILEPIGTFNTFDTYLVSRQIGSFPPQLFEHKSPSDFWGETITDGISNFLTDAGKVHFLNPYENEKRYPRNISVNSATQLNYFGDFVKTLDAEEQGGIIAINLQDDKIGLAICENDNFLFQVSDDFLRLGSDNIVRAAPVDSIISNPEAKVRGKYGCSYQDIGSIYFGDGFATFASEKNNAYIIHNYSVAQICGLALNQQSGLTETTCNSFFQKRMRQKANFNNNASNFLDHYRWSVGQNKTNNVIYLTIKSLRQSGANNSSALYVQPNETIMYTPISDVFLGMASFTPEGYNELSLATDDGCSFLSYQNSVPFVHSINSIIHNQFYGITCDEMVAISINADNKIIVPLSIEIQSEAKWFVINVKTDKETFFSEIPPVKVKRQNGKWNAAFLNDVNSIGGLYNGSNARGYFVEVLFIKDNSINDQYNTIDYLKRVAYNELDSILIKSMVSEQSGFTGNL